jgi:hypothetical protein
MAYRATTGKPTSRNADIEAKQGILPGFAVVLNQIKVNDLKAARSSRYPNTGDAIELSLGVCKLNTGNSFSRHWSFVMNDS